jgi:hypothetical protein
MSEQITNVSKGRDRARRYTPMLAIGASLLIAIFALPSVLNLPQANPNTVAEYAPVPPDQDTQAPPGGNFAGLGLGTGSTLTGEVGEPPPLPPLKGGARSAYRCVIVDGVPRQTEDPLSPPCVSTFSGDNGGKTYRGVSEDDITVVVYLGCSGNNNTFAPTSQGQESMECGSWDDIDEPPQDDDFLVTRILKRYSVYFNSRYQTYGRHVHMYAFYSHDVVAVTGPGGCREDCRRQDAAETLELRDPFAVLTSYDRGFTDAYSEAVARKGVLNFGGSSHDEAFYRRYPGLLWNYAPTFEQQADLYASALCRQVAKEPVSFSGVSGDMGKKRKFGILFSNEEGDPYYSGVKNRVVKRLAECGVAKPPEHGYADGGCSISCDPAAGPTHAAELTDLRNQGVTTILWIGAQTGEYPQQARRINWLPEWIVFGDGTQEDFITGRYGNQDVWEHIWTVSNVTKIERESDQLCALAMREVDPNFQDVDVPWACDFYDDLRQLFTGIQVAGPKLSPETVDSGFHAIPAVPSTNPQIPACFYRPKDYTCVKDAITMWWDRDGQIPGWSGQGCFRTVEGGKRYLDDGWPTRNITDAKNPAKDECNAYTSNGSFNPYQRTG